MQECGVRVRRACSRLAGFFDALVLRVLRLLQLRSRRIDRVREGDRRLAVAPLAVPPAVPHRQPTINADQRLIATCSAVGSMTTSACLIGYGPPPKRTRRKACGSMPSTSRSRQPFVEFDDDAVGVVCSRGAPRDHSRTRSADVPRVRAPTATRPDGRRTASTALLPQLEVENRPVFLLPAARHPAEHPLAHSFHEILRVARERDAKPHALPRDPAKRLDRAAQRHAVVRRRRLRDPIVPAREIARIRRSHTR